MAEQGVQVAMADGDGSTASMHRCIALVPAELPQLLFISGIAYGSFWHISMVFAWYTSHGLGYLAILASNRQVWGLQMYAAATSTSCTSAWRALHLCRALQYAAASCKCPASSLPVSLHQNAGIFPHRLTLVRDVTSLAAACVLHISLHPTASLFLHPHHPTLVPQYTCAGRYIRSCLVLQECCCTQLLVSFPIVTH
jgi:hypothetical protein